MEAVRRVSTVFTIDDSDHNRKLKTMNDQYRLTQSEIALAGKKLDAFGRSSGDLGFKQQALSKQVENLNGKMKLYRDSLEKVTTRAEENQKKLVTMKQKKDELTTSYKEAVKVYGKESDEAKKLGTELEELNKDYVEQERVVKSNVDTANKYQTQINKVESELVGVQAELQRTNAELARSRDAWIKKGEALERAGEKMKKVGDGMQTVGKNLSMYVTLPLVAMGTAAVNEAVKFESAFAGVKKTVDGTTEQIEGLRQGIIDMSLSIPSTTEEISAVAEAAGQLGIETDSIIDFTKVIIDLGNATNIVGDEGASQLAKFANITKMSQKDFDRLGSTIVELGNNLATTEADIVSMAMRLAGAGSQVGLSEAQILGLSGALSSVGIEAEAGGSAFSKVMIEMQLAAETGKGNLKNFAKVAGMSASDFAKAYKEDAAGALIAFIKGLSESEEKGISAIKVLDDMGITEVRMRDALLRAAGASDIFSDAIDLGTKAWDENLALTAEAEQRYATTESQMKIMKNEIADLGRELGEQLLPLVKDGMIFIKDLVQGFKDLSPETQENIIKFGLMAAAMGPVLSIGGKLVSGTGSLLSVAGKLAVKIGGTGGLTAATAGLSTAAGTAGGAAGMGALATGFGGALAAALPFVAGIAAVGLVGYGLYETLSQDVIPEVDLFADHVTYTAETITDEFGNVQTVWKETTTVISEETETQITSFFELTDEISQLTSDLYVGLNENTLAGMGDIVTKVEEANAILIQSSSDHRDAVVADYLKMFDETTTITDDEREAILASVTETHVERERKLQENADRLKEIHSEIARNGGTITRAMQEEINEIMDEMKESSIETMTQNQIEQEVILNRLAGNQERVTAEMVGDTIKQLNDQYDEVIRIAGEERDEKVRIAEQMRREGGVEAESAANKIIEEANREYEGVVEKADLQKRQGYDKLRTAHGDLVDQIDENTGTILTAWGKVKKWWDSWWPSSKTATIETINKNTYLNGNAPKQNYSPGYGANRQGYALGTSHAIGGLTKVNERGYEMIDLPVGSKVRNHESSKQMIDDTISKTVEKMGKYMRGVNVQGNQFIINDDSDPERIAKEIAVLTERELGGVGLGYSLV